MAGYFVSEKGVGEAARATLRALRHAEIPHVLNEIRDPGPVTRGVPDAAFSASNPYAVNLVHVNADGVAAFTRERGPDFFRGRYNIGYWFWELADFPSAWEASFRPFDEIWVASDFVRDAVSRTSPVPVVKIPPALSELVPTAPAGREHFGLPASPFLFLFVFDFASHLQRKNPLGLVRAFRAAFGRDDGAVLVLKCSRADHDPAGFRGLVEAASGSNIIIIDKIYTQDDIISLLNLSDCYVSLHRAEGFGLTLAQAMLLGKPVIATGYSGNTDFMTAANSLPVEFRLATLGHDYGPYPRGSSWADPDTAHAAELMRRVYRERDLGCRLGAQARRDVAAWCSPAAVGRAIRDRLATLSRQGRLPSRSRGGAPTMLAAARSSADEADYPALCARLREAVEAAAPVGATVVVASKGDAELVRFTGRTGWHFPRAADGGYAWFHPAGDGDAFRRLDVLREAGATHFLLPATAWWWQTHYPTFVADLRRGRVLLDDPAAGLLVDLVEAGADASGGPPGPGGCRVVIPVLNHSALTRQCLDAVFRTTPAGTEVVVVDDGSTDDTPEVLAGFGDRVAVVRHDRPAGFAAACNHGAAGADTDHLVFLNNDTIPEPGWLDALVRVAARYPGVGVVGAKLLYPDRTVQHAGLAVGQHGYPYHIYAGFPADHPAVNWPREFLMVTGACVLVRRALFDRLGGFDTGYLNGYEDTDLCLRARAAGASVRYCPRAVVVHLESATRGASPGWVERDRRNSQRFRARWGAELVPDDLSYYREDGLIQFSYQGPGHPVVTVSPLIGRVAHDPVG